MNFFWLKIFLPLTEATLTIFFGPRFLRQVRNVPDKKKKLTFEFFFIFFPPTCQQEYFFYQIGSISVKKIGKICQKMSDKKKKSDLWDFIFIFFFLRHGWKPPVRTRGPKNIVSVAWTFEISVGRTTCNLVLIIRT